MVKFRQTTAPNRWNILTLCTPLSPLLQRNISLQNLSFSPVIMENNFFSYLIWALLKLHTWKKFLLEKLCRTNKTGVKDAAVQRGWLYQKVFKEMFPKLFQASSSFSKLPTDMSKITNCACEWTSKSTSKRSLLFWIYRLGTAKMFRYLAKSSSRIGFKTYGMFSEKCSSRLRYHP